MCPSNVPSSFTSSNIGGNGIKYFAFLESNSSCAPLTLNLRYVAINMMGTSLFVSILGLSPLGCRDYLVDEILGNVIVLGGVFITVVCPPISN